MLFKLSARAVKEMLTYIALVRIVISIQGFNSPKCACSVTLDFILIHHFFIDHLHFAEEVCRSLIFFNFLPTHHHIPQFYL